eukprot:1732989-Pyramimonas_sp.AAC.3
MWWHPNKSATQLGSTGRQRAKPRQNARSWPTRLRPQTRTASARDQCHRPLARRGPAISGNSGRSAATAPSRWFRAASGNQRRSAKTATAIQWRRAATARASSLLRPGGARKSRRLQGKA